MNANDKKLGMSFNLMNVTQFLGALNDNVFKLMVIALFIGLSSPEQAGGISATAGMIFVVPFLLFTAFAGVLADRYSKSRIIVATKAMEVLVMGLGCVGFYLQSIPMLYGVLFLMALQSAFFSPSKYGIIPELVKPQQLSRANSFIEALTYLAIVLGTAAAPKLLSITDSNYPLAALGCVIIAIVGFALSLMIKRTKSAGGSNKASVFFLRDIFKTLKVIRKDVDLLLAVFASAYFLLIAAFIHINVIPYAVERLNFDATQAGYLFVPAAIGIGVGSFLAGKLSGRNVEFGIVPIGAIGLAVSSIGLGVAGGGLMTARVLLFLMGTSAGLFIVPIQAFIQLRSPDQSRGEVLAAANFIGWVGVLVASVSIYLFSKILHLSASQIFVILGAMTLLIAVWAVIALPDFLFRFLCFIVTNLCYRIRVSGIENVPVKGGSLLVCNHVSWVDALLLNATQQRRIRFVMDKGFYENKWLKPLFKLVRVIPISESDAPKKIVTSLKKARAAMDDGYIVCIFAEGAITRNGMLMGFKGGLERIMKGSNYKIIPTYIGGAWGSIFSYYNGKPLSTVPKKFPYPVSVHFGQAMPADSTAQQIRQKVSEISCEYFEQLKPSRRSLAENFVQTARKNRRRRCISDTTGKQLNYGKALVSSIILAGRIRKLAKDCDKVGIILPPSVPAALCNVALAMLGKVAVNLNYVVSHRARMSSVDQCELKCIITSREFVEKVDGIDTIPGVVFIEDIVRDITVSEKFSAWLKSWLLPARILSNARRFKADDLVTVIFSSGSNGEPKGVMLSHHNIISNIEAMRMVFKLEPNDNLCAVLPFFHSFGFTCSLWLPLISGVSASYVPNPLDGALVGRSVRENRSTILFAAPTFLLNYIRRTDSQDMRSLRSVVVGAEKLKIRIADSFEEKFGVRPLEGYGATELSPVVSLNILDTESDDVFHVGNKPGTVGHPLPGVAVRTVDVDRKEPLPPGEPGLLMVKGPNIMIGYMDKPIETSNVLSDGWYNTGDIASVDPDGFITISDRLSRFSKIGGEMVPHLGVEDVLLRGLDTSEQVLAVTSVPEPKKGEELVVLYTEKAGPVDDLHKIIVNSDLPNMWKPRKDNFIEIDSMPLLGSGKLDIMELKKIAAKQKDIAVG